MDQEKAVKIIKKLKEMYPDATCSLDFKTPFQMLVAVCLSVFIYLLIGPLFAEPRTGSVSFELAVAPYVNESNMWIAFLIFRGIFFLLT